MSHRDSRRKRSYWQPENMPWSQPERSFAPHMHVHHKKPDWWPENEPWPPVRPPWRIMRSRFSRRVGCLLGLVNFLAFILLIIVLGWAANSLGLVQIPDPMRWLVPAGVILFIVGGVSLVWAGRRLRRYYSSLNDLLEAVGHVAEGDYSARVRENGLSETRNLARAFNSMAARLQTASEQRRNLLADVTHELRSPLTVIRGNLEGMLDGVYPFDEAHLKSILEETQLLDRLVEDLRTLALAESGALQLRREPTDLTALINETVPAFRAQADSAGVTLGVETPADAPAISIDPERIRQVLANLINNALRYTPSEGKIQVHYEMIDSAEEKQAAVTVTDNGIGIVPEVLPHVFERFYKSRDSSGTGLGLPIAKFLVEAHGGKITATSVLGQGTTIRFVLPIDDP